MGNNEQKGWEVEKGKLRKEGEGNYGGREREIKEGEEGE